MTPEEKVLVQKLHSLFSVEFCLYFTTHSAHWGITGVNFFEIHSMLDEQYKQIQEVIDEVAEKIRQLDAVSPYDLPKVVKDGLDAGIIDCHNFSAAHMAKALMVNHENAIDHIQACIKAAKDAGREDFVNYLGGLWEKHGKMRWMLRSTANEIQTRPFNGEVAESG